MERSVGQATNRRGRPRSEATRRAILDAAATLLVERSPRKISVEAIAARAGASKATVYRWWRSKEALLLEVYAEPLEAVSAAAAAPTDPFPDALLAAVRARLAHFAAHPEAARTATALLAAAQDDPAFRAPYVAGAVVPLRARTQEILEAAIGRGEVGPDIDLELALDLVFGPITLRVLQGHAPADDHFARGLADLVVRAIAPPADATSSVWAGAPLPLHAALVYDDDVALRGGLVPLVTEGLARGEKAIHLVDPAARAAYVPWLETAGVGAAEAVRRGQFEVRGWDETYLRGGRFDRDSMLALIQDLLASADAQGFPGTRLFAHMEWALEGWPGSETLMDYESRLNAVLPRGGSVVVCLYDAATFGGAAVLDALRTHPLVLADGRLRANPLYAPPGRPELPPGAAGWPTADA